MVWSSSSNASNVTNPDPQHQEPEFLIQLRFDPVEGSDQDLDPVFLESWICIRNRTFLDVQFRIRVPYDWDPDRVTPWPDPRLYLGKRQKKVIFFSGVETK